MTGEPDRGVSNPLAYTMTLAITAVFVLALMTSAGGMLSDQREHATESDLRTIGNRLATDIAAVDTRANSGANVSIRSEHPARVAGSQYHAVIETGAECDRTRFHTDACLRLWAENPDATAYVPLHNDSAISMTAGDDGTVTLSADNASLTRELTFQNPPVAAAELVSDVNLSAPFDATKNHVAHVEFAVNRSTPQRGQPIEFNASESFDADGIIVAYHWDWEADGTVDTTTTSPVVTHTFSSGGHYNVTLTVTDDEGVNASSVRTVQVGGLVYNDDLEAHYCCQSITAPSLSPSPIPTPPPSPSPSFNPVVPSPDRNAGRLYLVGGPPALIVAARPAINFTVTNTYASEVNITHVMVDPRDDDVVWLNGSSGHAVTINETNKGATPKNKSYPVHDQGIIMQLNRSTVEPIAPGESAHIHMERFVDSYPWNPPTPEDSRLLGTEFRVGLKYEVLPRTSGTYATNTTVTQFTDTAAFPPP